jgi:hypothetical protein
VSDLSPGCLCVNPEFNLQRNWRMFLSAERRAAEELLGYKPDQLSQFWETVGNCADKLVLVPPGEEYDAVRAIFLSEPVEPAHHVQSGSWANRARMVSNKCVENRGQEGVGATTTTL